MPNLIESLRACFAGKLLTEAAEMAPFLTDWRKMWTGAALAVVQPWLDARGIYAGARCGLAQPWPWCSPIPRGMWRRSWPGAMRTACR